MSESLAQGSTLVVPSVVENTFGDTGDNPMLTPIAQQIYGASLFTGTQSSVIQITGIAFRVNELASSSLDVVIPNVLLRMGVFRGNISDVPTDSIGNDTGTITVFSARNFHLLGGRGKSFDLKFAFSTPFVYNRNEGQLALLMQMPAFVPGAEDFDAQSTSEGVYLYSEGFLGVASREIALATTFSYVAVPEPSSSTVLLVGAILYATFLRRKDRK